MQGGDVHPEGLSHCGLLRHTVSREGIKQICRCHNVPTTCHPHQGRLEKFKALRVAMVMRISRLLVSSGSPHETSWLWLWRGQPIPSPDTFSIFIGTTHLYQVLGEGTRIQSVEQICEVAPVASLSMMRRWAFSALVTPGRYLWLKPRP